MFVFCLFFNSRSGHRGVNIATHSYVGVGEYGCGWEGRGGGGGE